MAAQQVTRTLRYLESWAQLLNWWSQGSLATLPPVNSEFTFCKDALVQTGCGAAALEPGHQMIKSVKLASTWTPLNHGKFFKTIRQPKKTTIFNVWHDINRFGESCDSCGSYWEALETWRLPQSFLHIQFLMGQVLRKKRKIISYSLLSQLEGFIFLN